MKEENVDKEMLQLETITVDQDGQNCLSVLLAGDGTINRKGDLACDTSDHVFFMGITKEKYFDTLADNAPGEVLQLYTEKGTCDTTGHYCRVKITLATASQEVVVIEHCVNGELADQPKPLFDYIHKVVRVTDPWYNDQLKIMKH
ncbi:MAG: hypothetical protein ACJ77K_12800 [Bacteroidia bacterium]